MAQIDRKRYNVYNDPDKNPCIKEEKLSRNCLIKNDSAKEKCSLYFENCRRCRIFWADVMNARRKNNINPVLPNEDERILIKMEHKKGNRVYKV